MYVVNTFSDCFELFPINFEFKSLNRYLVFMSQYMLSIFTFQASE